MSLTQNSELKTFLLSRRYMFKQDADTTGERNGVVFEGMYLNGVQLARDGVKAGGKFGSDEE
jgi:hypothetical protein